MTQEKEFAKMSFEQLIKYEIPEDISSEDWQEYEHQVKRKAPAYFRELDSSQLDEFYRIYSGDGIDPWFDAWSDSKKQCFPFSEIFEKLGSMETSLQVLLKEHENTPAKITIGQLNRLKSGI